MDMSAIAARLGLSGSRPVVRKAAELRRLCDVTFDSSVLGIVSAQNYCPPSSCSLSIVGSVSDLCALQGEVCKAIICLEIAASKFQVIFDRAEAVRMSGMSEKAYIRSFNALQNGLGVKVTLDVRELGIQFGCVRLIPFVQKGLSLYKERFLAALPPSRRASTDFGRPVFTAAAFYLCAKRHKLKVDKLKLIDLCATSSSEFTTVSTSMADLCFDVFGIAKEKKDPKYIKGNRELLDVLPSKRKHEDDSDLSGESSEDDQDELDLPTHKRHKKMEKQAYNQWKSSVLSSNKQANTDPAKPRKQAQLNFKKKPADIAVEVSSAAN
ncbi:LOW QUALITY PROTEIN: origin of replication complex subunit 6-like [Phragmites australis]|uniref:LOW QUALITY PROTEIN: origin of replication complex subunit 6-like n=1 Tax=Phragmites australis TaxID=29695 RepID=UPI002D79EA5A|nr:LOW QUALITY PROTEIN: origin of replication complex subunit 6-like [Phragmites australis]